VLWAVLAALTATAASLLVRGVWDLRPLPEQALGRGVQLIPAPLFELGIRSLGGAAKPLLFLTLTLLEAAGLALLGWFWLRRGWARPLVSLERLALGLCTAAWLALMPLLGLGPFGAAAPEGALRAAAGPALTYVVWALSLAATRWLLLGQGAAADPTRRRLTIAGGAWAALAASGLASGLWLVLSRTTITRLGRAAARTPAVTPTESFYIVSKNVVDPTVRASTWRLQVGGDVERPLTLTLDEVRALPSAEQWTTLECISNPVGGNLIGNASWRGTPLAEVLRRCGVREGAYDVVTECADGYTESLELGKALAPTALLAYEMNGEPLTQKHGAPLRLLSPGVYGLKSSKWVRSIRVVTDDYKGYWQSESGWTDLAGVYTECRIDRPPDGLVPREGWLLTGVAYTGRRGVSRVEVSTDDGRTWEEAQLDQALGPLTWRLWSYQWLPTTTGFTTVKARAYDAEGLPQEEVATAEYGGRLPIEDQPESGAAGIHGLNLTVLES
jgi:DMSO/TMAO reductase YedYZ molybdopterin-dependent catalytic subunit